MENRHVLERLRGIQQILRGVHQAGAQMSADTKGQERAAFVDQFLSQVLPLPYRFGKGDATDIAGRRSGQLDVVVEYPFSPSLPLGVGTSRLYLAEGVAAVIEVKSDVAGQWTEVERTARLLAPLTRKMGMLMTTGSEPTPNIPLFVVGYTGWTQLETVQRHLQAAPEVAGVLVIDPGVFVSNARFGGIKATGPWAMWGLVSSLYGAVSSLLAAANEPLRYALPDAEPAN